MSDLAYARTFSGSVDEAIERFQAALKPRGFGVLATIKVHEILEQKLGTRMDPLVILDVCSPTHAREAINISRDVALLLPCKVVISQEGGKTRVALQRPTVALGTLLPLPRLDPLGQEVEKLLREAVDATVGPG